MVGLRFPIFASAGIHGMPLSKFVFWDLFGLFFSAPLVIGLGFFFADRLDLVKEALASAQYYILGGVVIAGVAFFVRSRLRRRALAVEK